MSDCVRRAVIGWCFCFWQGLVSRPQRGSFSFLLRIIYRIYKGRMSIYSGARLAPAAVLVRLLFLSVLFFFLLCLSMVCGSFLSE
jgi:hypothetical protein